MNGARNFAEKKYKGKQWKRKSATYRREHPLCERCLERGKYTPSEIVHHINEISIDNYHDNTVWYDDDNLMALCRECHGIVHREMETAEFADDGTLYLDDD